MIKLFIAKFKFLYQKLFLLNIITNKLSNIEFLTKNSFYFSRNCILK